MTPEPGGPAVTPPGTFHRFESEADARPLSVDGIRPSFYAQPATVEELACCLQSAARRETPVVPIGGGNLLDLGQPPRAYKLALQLHRLDRIVDYQPADMTVTVQAGVRLNALSDVLATRRQWLPLDPPTPQQQTVGGTIAANLFGPCRVSQGRVRDLLLGIRVVQADGRVVKAGGRVVKNVAGYDLSKLYVGSLGSLGIVAEATLKLKPVPEAVRHCLVSASDIEAAVNLGLHLADAKLGPFILASYLDRGFSETASCGLLVSFAGPQLQVEWQRKRLTELTGRQAVDIDDSFYRRIRDRPLSAETRITWQAAMVPRLAGAFTTVMLDELGSRLGIQASAVVLPDSGSVWVGIPLSSEIEVLARLTDRWRTQAETAGGRLVLRRAPRKLKARVSVWGSWGGQLKLLRRLKERLDPLGILSPGRFGEGL